MASYSSSSSLMDERLDGEGIKPSLAALPPAVLDLILSHCDEGSLRNLSGVSGAMSDSVGKFAERKRRRRPAPTLGSLPVELTLDIFKRLDKKSLGRVAQTCRWFKALAYSDSIWMKESKKCIITNALSTPAKKRMLIEPSARDKVRVSDNWTRGHFVEDKMIVQNINYMPRLQLHKDVLWVSWGNKIWAHPRTRADGIVDRTTTKVLTGHSDDVSRFVAKDGLLVSGGRDATIMGWKSDTGEFLFAKRYCHGSDVCAVDWVRKSGTVISGSRDSRVKLWSLKCHRGYEDNRRATAVPELAATLELRDRVWSLAADPTGKNLAVGTAGYAGIPALHMVDLARPDCGAYPITFAGSRGGAATFDLQWHNEHTFVSGSFDACARLWDTRTAMAAPVATWEEPFDEAVYCLATDGAFSMVCGLARYGLTRLWDMRTVRRPVQQYYSRPTHQGNSSPVYSVAFDQSNLYVALENYLSLLSFWPHREERLRRERQVLRELETGRRGRQGHFSKCDRPRTRRKPRESLCVRN